MPLRKFKAGIAKMSNKPTSTVGVQVPTQLFLSLASFLQSEGDVRDPTEVIPLAIDYWMDNAAWKEDFIEKARHGFRWKELFLPDGSQIRMRYKGRYHYASVKSDEFVSDVGASSPSQFANKVASSSRNAWRDLEVRRPNDIEWHLAQNLREALSPNGRDR